MNFVSAEKELTNSNYLIQKIVDSKFMDNNTIIINCSPEYSSRLVQLINHKTSYLNNSEPYEQLNLDIPNKYRSQIYSFEDKEYVSFDRYLNQWLKKHYIVGQRYLFVINTAYGGSHLRKIKRGMINQGIDIFNMMFVALYNDLLSDFQPDFFGQVFGTQDPPVFFWENKNK